jgi:hypothetical protein
MDEMREWIGWRVDDVNGSAIGRLSDVIADDAGRPEWLAINELRFGTGRRFFAPAREATGSARRVWLPLDRRFVRSSAELGNPVRSPQALRRLRAHYGAAGRRAA